MSICKAHSKPYTFICRDTDCPVAFICDHADCLSQHHHNTSLKIYSVKRLLEAVVVDPDTDRPMMEATKNELDNYFDLMKNELMVHIEKMRNLVYLEVDKIAMQLSNIDFGIKDAHQALLLGNLDAINKKDAINLAVSMKSKMDLSTRMNMYDELKSEILQRISRSESLIELLSKSTAFTQVFKFKSSYKGPRITREIKRFKEPSKN
jgi:hypothetical protein